MRGPRLPMDPANWGPDEWREWKQWDRRHRKNYTTAQERDAQQLREWYRDFKKYPK